MRALALFAIVVLAALPARADETVALKKAPGLAQVEANCQACHSLAYIPMNSRFLGEKGWDAEVNKMIHVMGAPIDDADAKAIRDYLGTNY